MKLAKLREIASKRTASQWIYEPERYSAKCVIGQQGEDRWIAHFLPEGNGEANAQFSVAMANHFDALLDVVEAARTYQHVHHRDDVDICATCVALAKLEAIE